MQGKRRVNAQCNEMGKDSSLLAGTVQPGRQGVQTAVRSSSHHEIVHSA